MMVVHCFILHRINCYTKSTYLHSNGVSSVGFMEMRFIRVHDQQCSRMREEEVSAVHICGIVKSSFVC